MYNNISLPSWPAEKAFWTQLCLYFLSTLTSPMETHSCHASLPFPVQISHYKQHYIGQIWRRYRPARNQAPVVDRVKAKSTQLYIKIGFASARGGKFIYLVYKEPKTIIRQVAVAISEQEVVTTVGSPTNRRCVVLTLNIFTVYKCKEQSVFQSVRFNFLTFNIVWQLVLVQMVLLKLERPLKYMVASILENIIIKTKHEPMFWIDYYKMMCHKGTYITRTRKMQQLQFIIIIYVTFLCTKYFLI